MEGGGGGGSILSAMTANMVSRGLVPEVDASSLAQKLQAAVRDLRVACRVSYAFQINEDKMTSWKTASLGTVLKSVHVTPEVQAKIHAVYDEAIVQMRTLLDETYDRTVAEMTHRLDAFEKELTAQAAASHASLVDDLELRYAATKLELEHIIADMHKEHDHQRMQIIYLETRLKALEGAPDRGDVELCNQLRTRVVELEAAVEASAARVAQVQNDNATAKRRIGHLESDAVLRQAKWDMTQGMYARETTQLCDIIRMNEAQFMAVATAVHRAPSPTKPSAMGGPGSPTRGGVQRYDPHSGRVLLHTSPPTPDLVSTPSGVQYISTTSPTRRPPSSPHRRPVSDKPLPILPTATVHRPYI
ncbi:hypothetical protein H257_05761 [Aphanomyces astaci]|uniref:Uncharacterized protein n=1 Tax=Aphanomyces astaci TaxID=112090 RepID=W4GQ95_APHAT|nr:hypothetical protein H257_05761 [Aphanomyces astaci]ETV81174.1 hypothetical protein H257_05761 [Aphanomyces astaci]|eukprot:XP_009829032.1 hypothetical protein H257_05761 [Aphanomyces astaci]